MRRRNEETERRRDAAGRNRTGGTTGGGSGQLAAKSSPLSSLRLSVSASLLSPFDLYELCVQSPHHVVPLLRAIHGRNPTTLAEDFCGTAAISRTWVELNPRARAIATDHDPKVLAIARILAPHPSSSSSSSSSRPPIRFLRSNLLTPRSLPPADVIFVGNFSIGEIHDRPGLIKYLRRCRARLRRGGVFVCDTYGGESAFRPGGVERRHPGPGGATIRYTWEQRRADPLTGMVENALHFRVERNAEIVQELTDAFVYRWRLRSVPELRDAMTEAGFKTTEVYDQLPGGIDQHGDAYVTPITDPADLDPSFIVCVAGRR